MRLKGTIIFLFFAGLASQAQVLRDINYSYYYGANETFSFQWKAIKQANGYVVYYQLSRTDTTQTLKDFTVEWETRNSISEKNSFALSTSPQMLVEKPWRQAAKFTLTGVSTPSILVAKVKQAEQKRTTVMLFYKHLPPVESPYFLGEQALMTNAYILKDQAVTISGFDAGKPVIISYYNDPFPAAAPAFSTSQSKVPKTIKPDSVFSPDLSQSISFPKKGLYLAQHDTASAQGFAFRVEDDYPKLGKLESLGGPLIYICTKQEYERLQQAGSDKKKFDQVILSITGNAERARNFMRSYYKRVELANVYFTSYKEGWKTDRGMIYIIFGAPDEVYFFEGREVWEYKNDKTKQRFQFVKSATLFDPDNYVLVRDKKFTNAWFEKVDLWRKARF
jgi:GWxTD domain-containing protein